MIQEVAAKRIFKSAAVKDLHMFARKLVLKKLHNKLRQDDSGWTPEELRVIDILEGLESESTPSVGDGHR